MEYVRYKGKKYEVKRWEPMYEGDKPTLDGTLSLRGQNIKDITEIEGLDNLIYIKDLDLAENQITEIKGLENLKGLNGLDLSHNQINRITGLENLNTLKSLDLGKNKITKITGLKTLTYLESLWLYDNYISEIEGLETLLCLRKLDIRNNQINEIKGLENLISLGSLNLSSNQITDLKGIGILRRLRNLRLNNNQITDIKELRRLKKLSLLSIKNNQISDLKGLENLKRLIDLYIKGNKITEPIRLTTIKDKGILNILAKVPRKDFELDISFKINDYITLKLGKKLSSSLPKKESVIYVDNKRFTQCKFLLIPIFVNEIKTFDEIDSIDEAEEKMDHSLEYLDRRSAGISIMTEFWAHCSNLQVWVENDYDTRLLHRNLAFPLLKRLTDVGDPIAKKVFKEEIAKRYASGHPSVVRFLEKEGYIRYLSKEELESII